MEGSLCIAHTFTNTREPFGIVYPPTLVVSLGQWGIKRGITGCNRRASFIIASKYGSFWMWDSSTMLFFPTTKSSSSWTLFNTVGTISVAWTAEFENFYWFLISVSSVCVKDVDETCCDLRQHAFDHCVGDSELSYLQVEYQYKRYKQAKPHPRLWYGQVWMWMRDGA